MVQKGKTETCNVSHLASVFSRQLLDSMVKDNTQRWEGRDTKYSDVKWAHSNYVKRSCVFKRMNAIYWSIPPWRNCFLIIFSLEEDPSSIAYFYFSIWKRKLSFKKKEEEWKLKLPLQFLFFFKKRGLKENTLFKRKETIHSSLIVLLKMEKGRQNGNCPFLELCQRLKIVMPQTPI